ncbi:MAG: monovalent cation/H+ antiporter subunit D family protein, partial [Acidobacteriota bacterium]|nr:monovalent cation/H+ antiporter subunit D family protein [Acidobacteriota bacterium]
METQLPALLIVVPLLAAPLCVIIRHRRLVQPFALLVAWATFVLSIAMALRVHSDGTWVYALGDWAAPWGIEYRIDTLSCILAIIVSGIGAWVLTYAPRSVAHEIEEGRHYLFYTAYLLCITGLLGITITGDLFNVFVFLEVSSLSGYVLIALGRDRRSLMAALQYLVLGTIGATFILIGIGLMYMMTGTLNMADMAVQLAEVGNNRTILVAFAFFTVGVFIKMAVFPLHAWLPNAYTSAPSVVTAFLAATATKAAVYVLLRFVFSVYGIEFATFHRLPTILLVLALVGIFMASTVAIFQQNVKRILAYSSVAQIGYMVLGISFFSVTGLTAGIVHLFNHALIKGGLFLAMGCVILRVGSVRLKDMAGIGRQMPWTMLAWVLGG